MNTRKRNKFKIYQFLVNTSVNVRNHLNKGHSFIKIWLDEIK